MEPHREFSPSNPPELIPEEDVFDSPLVEVDPVQDFPDLPSRSLVSISNENHDMIVMMQAKLDTMAEQQELTAEAVEKLMEIVNRLVTLMETRTADRNERSKLLDRRLRDEYEFKKPNWNADNNSPPF